MITVESHVLENLCKQIDISADKLTYLGGGREDSDGIVYTYEENGKKKVLKILGMELEKKRELSAFEERAKFTNYLGECGVNMSYPLFIHGDQLYVSENTDKHIFLAYIMDFCQGTSPSTDRLCTNLSYHWGKLIGATHRFTQEYPIWKNLQCNSFEYGYQDELDLFTNWCKEDSVKQAWHEIGNKFATFPVNRQCYGLIHNDNHQHNIIVNGSDIALIDMDCITGQFFFHEIVVPMQGIMFDMTGGMERPIANMDPLKQYLDHFINGYEKENHLDSKWLKEITTFINYRRLLLFTVMQDYLNTNKELKDGFIRMIKEPVEVSL